MPRTRAPRCEPLACSAHAVSPLCVALQAAADVKAGDTLISLPSKCHLTYDGSTDARLLALIDQVPAELWGAKLALQASALFGAAGGRRSFSDCVEAKCAAQLFTPAPAPCFLPVQVVAHRLLGEASPFSPYIRNLPMVSQMQ